MTDSSEPENIYLDILMTNVNNENTSPIPINYYAVRDTPIIKTPSDYEMSIVRFSLDTTTLPVIVPIIQYNQSNTDLTIYSVTLEYDDPSGNTFTEQQYFIYESQNKSIAVPPPPSQQSNGLQSNANTYYNIYNYQYWIYLVNNAFNTCFASLLSSAGSLPTTHAPVTTLTPRITSLY
jgi:hypothetical protein